MSTLNYQKDAFFTRHGIPAEINNLNDNFLIDWKAFKISKIKYIKEKLIIDTSKDYFYYWLIIFSIAYIYNLMVNFIIYFNLK